MINSIRELVRPYQIGGFLGFILGLVLFFNLPSLTEAVTNTLLITLLGSITGHTAQRPDNRNILLNLISAAVIIFTAVTPYICDGYGLMQPPAKNPLTGEIDTVDFDGFRLEPCDHGEYPWYYQEMPDNPEKFRSYCRNNTDSQHCKAEYGPDGI